MTRRHLAFCYVLNLADTPEIEQFLTRKHSVIRDGNRPFMGDFHANLHPAERSGVSGRQP